MALYQLSLIIVHMIGTRRELLVNLQQGFRGMERCGGYGVCGGQIHRDFEFNGFWLVGSGKIHELFMVNVQAAEGLREGTYTENQPGMSRQHAELEPTHKSDRAHRRGDILMHVSLQRE